LLWVLIYFNEIDILIKNIFIVVLIQLVMKKNITEEVGFFLNYYSTYLQKKKRLRSYFKNNNCFFLQEEKELKK